MIRRVQALNCRCLRYVDLSLDRFHVLVGPNASGKSTLFDVVAFLGDVIREGVGAAIERRAENFKTWLEQAEAQHGLRANRRDQRARMAGCRDAAFNEFRAYTGNMVSRLTAGWRNPARRISYP